MKMAPMPAGDCREEIQKDTCLIRAHQRRGFAGNQDFCVRGQRSCDLDDCLFYEAQAPCRNSDVDVTEREPFQSFSSGSPYPPR